MKLISMPLPAGTRAEIQPVLSGVEGGESLPIAPVFERTQALAALDPFVCQDMLWCVNCGGRKLFQPVDFFAFGKRGYCMGCGETKYVMDERTNSEVA